jgi:hypothetical protein
MYVKFGGGRILWCTWRGWNSFRWAQLDWSKGVGLDCFAWLGLCGSRLLGIAAGCLFVRLGERVDENRPNLPPWTATSSSSFSASFPWPRTAMRDPNPPSPLSLAHRYPSSNPHPLHDLRPRPLCGTGSWLTCSHRRSLEKHQQHHPQQHHRHQ